MNKPIYTSTIQAAGGGSSASSPLRDLNGVITSSSTAINTYNREYSSAASAPDSATIQAQLRSDLRVLLRTQAAIAYQSGQLYK